MGGIRFISVVAQKEDGDPESAGSVGRGRNP
jgi:hypothetical protein